MKILTIFPQVDGLDGIVEEIKSELSSSFEEVTFDVRHHFDNAKKTSAKYDVVIIHQNVSSVELDIEDFDSISDKSNAVVIPLVNGKKGDELSKRLFALGIYNALYQDDSSTKQIANIIKKQRNRTEAKNYLGITTDNIDKVSDRIIDEKKLKRLIEFIGTDSHDEHLNYANAIKKLTIKQKLYLTDNLPEKLKEDLEDSDLYKKHLSILNGDDAEARQKTVIIEQSVATEKVVEKTTVINQVSNQRKLFTVYGNSELCAEMAYVAAKNSVEDVLIIDAEALIPDIHYVLGMKNTVNEGISINNLYTESSFLQAYELAATSRLNYDMMRSISVKYKYDNLHVLTGNDNIKKHESFDWEPLEYMISVAMDVYGSVFVNIPSDIYDPFALFMLQHPKSTVIMPFNGGAIDLRHKMKLIEIIKQPQGISLKNVKYLAYEYKSENLEESEIKALTTGMYIGKIPYDTSRVKLRNDLKSSYSSKMSRKMEDHYREILAKLGLETKVKLTEKVGRIFKKGA